MNPYRSILLLGLLLAVRAPAQEERAYIITDVHGRSQTWLLSGERPWVLTADELVLVNGVRLKSAGVASARPKYDAAPPGHHAVTLVFPGMRGRALAHTFWFPERYAVLGEVPLQNGFRVIDERTVVREGAYTREEQKE